MARGPRTPGTGRFYGPARDLHFHRAGRGSVSEHCTMTFRARILWFAGLIALAAAFGLLPQGHAEERAPTFRL